MNKIYRGWEFVPEEPGKYFIIKEGMKLFEEAYDEAFLRRMIDRYEYIGFEIDLDSEA